jgi:hypothetical protein
MEHLVPLGSDSVVLARVGATALVPGLLSLDLGIRDAPFGAEMPVVLSVRADTSVPIRDDAFTGFALPVRADTLVAGFPALAENRLVRSRALSAFVDDPLAVSLRLLSAGALEGAPALLIEVLAPGSALVLEGCFVVAAGLGSLDLREANAHNSY